MDHLMEEPADPDRHLSRKVEVHLVELVKYSEEARCRMTLVELMRNDISDFELCLKLKSMAPPSTDRFQTPALQSLKEAKMKCPNGPRCFLHANEFHPEHKAHCTVASHPQLRSSGTVNDDVDGMTALMLAAFHGRLVACQRLAYMGADVLQRDDDGKDALDWAREGQCPKVVEYVEALHQEKVGYLRVLDRDLRGLRMLHHVILKATANGQASRVWWKAGDRVLSPYKRDYGMYAGTIHNVSHEGTVSIHYDDGDTWDSAPSSPLRPVLHPQHPYNSKHRDLCFIDPDTVNALKLLQRCYRKVEDEDYPCKYAKEKMVDNLLMSKEGEALSSETLAGMQQVLEPFIERFARHIRMPWKKNLINTYLCEVKEKKFGPITYFALWKFCHTRAISFSREKDRVWMSHSGTHRYLRHDVLVASGRVSEKLVCRNVFREARSAMMNLLEETA
mmetsp:Transcript_37514/g.72692  ORF Transcript_37514/g.72692 Transcript_37514/m.72692 type:complete len:448 (-) Transcript_37514:13-1356(-)